jgi:hypothetical protein
VSRALAAILVLALVATLNLVPGIGPIGGDRAAAADCTWQRHAKRVVKQVRRDGRVRRVVRVKRWWACDPVAPPAAVALPPAATVPLPVAPPQDEPEPPPRRVSVKAGDATPEAFSFSLSRPFVVAGEVTVELNNQGEDPHNLNLQPEGGEGPPLEVGEAGPGENRVGRFNLAPGTYRLWCSLLQHEEWGMKVDLEVRAG